MRFLTIESLDRLVLLTNVFTHFCKHKSALGFEHLFEFIRVGAPDLRQSFYNLVEIIVGSFSFVRHSLFNDFTINDRFVILKVDFCTKILKV